MTREFPKNCSQMSGIVSQYSESEMKSTHPSLLFYNLHLFGDYLF